MKILFLVPYPYDKAPSQRFRYEQYLGELKARGWKYHISPFLDERAWGVLYKEGFIGQKVLSLLRGYFRRVIDLFLLFQYDIVFIHREAGPFGPPIFEWLIAKVFRKKMVFDFDDAIWIPNASQSNSRLTHAFKYFGNASKIIRWSTIVSAGNKYLADYALRFNKNVVVNPTTIDTELYHNVTTDHSNHRFIIGWTGSHSTVQFLDPLVPVFEYLQARFDFELHVICDVPPRFQLPCLVYIPWSKEAEVNDLLRMNVGIMPLPDSEWAKGKCGFKALQYMAVGVPAVISKVGVNEEIVEHGVNGFLCKDAKDFQHYLECLLADPALVRRLSNKARVRIQDKYSVQSNSSNFISLFDASDKS